ncbi:allene oxide synthase-lipoxygenase -like, partial [Paramuricea clavata]
MKYKITVTTGTLRGAGTDASISIKLTGKDGAETGKFKLDKFFHDDFERGETDTYEVSGDDVGDVVMIILNNNGMAIKSDWYIAKVVVEKMIEGGTEKYEFPCYRWVVHHLVVYEGK